MASSISAAVGDKARKPDPKAKVKQGPVANKKGDVELVQLMLKAAGVNVKVTGAVDAATIKGIQTLEKQAGDKPDGVIDPGDATWKKFVGKLDAQIAADQKALAGKVIVKQDGKEVVADQKQFEAEEAKVRKALERRAAMFVSCAESWMDFAKESNEALQGAKGFMDSMTEFFVQWKDENAVPPVMVFADALSEAKLLLSFARNDKMDLKKILDQDRKAVKAQNDGVKAFKKWNDARIGSAESIASGLTVVQDVSFSVVEVYVTAQLTLRGYSPAQANAMAAASVTAVKTTANQIGEGLAGNKVTVGSAAKKVVWETLWAGVAGAAGGKLSGAFAAKAERAFVAAYALKFKAPPAILQPLEKGIIKALGNARCQEAMVSIAKDTLGLMKSSIENGKFPSAKEFQDTLVKAVVAGLLKFPAFEDFGKVQQGAANKVTALMGKLVPARLDKMKDALTKQYGRAFAEKFLKENSDDLLKEVAKGFNAKMVEVFVLGAADALGSLGDARAQEKAGEAAVQKDGALEKAITDLIAKKAAAEAKKHGVPAR